MGDRDLFSNTNTHTLSHGGPSETEADLWQGPDGLPAVCQSFLVSPALLITPPPYPLVLSFSSQVLHGTRGHRWTAFHSTVSVCVIVRKRNNQISKTIYKSNHNNEPYILASWQPSLCFLPVGCVADFFVLLELVADHLKELVGVGTQVLHQAHQILDGLFHHHCALNGKKNCFRVVVFLILNIKSLISALRKNKRNSVINKKGKGRLTFM